MATPCCPAPVSAMILVLPSRLASKICPMALLILCEPVWFKSSRLEKVTDSISMAHNKRREPAPLPTIDPETHFIQILAPPACSVNLSAKYKLLGLFMYPYIPSNSFQNDGSARALL